MVYLVILVEKGHHPEHCKGRAERGKTQGTTVDGRELPMEIRIVPEIPISLPSAHSLLTSLPLPTSFKILWL